MADDVIGHLDSLKIDKASILGSSMGGLIAQEIAINYPDRVNKLLLCSTYSCLDAESGFTAKTANVAALTGVKAFRLSLSAGPQGSPLKLT